MKTKLTQLCVLILLSSCGNYLDDIVLNDIRVKTSILTIEASTWENNKPMETNPELSYTWFDKGGIFTTKGGYSGKLLDGGYQASYASGYIAEQGTYKKGLKHGEWLSWDSNGKLESRYTWKKGKLHGSYFLYDESEKLSESGKYKNDLLHGVRYRYSSNGAVIKDKYKKGELVVKEPKQPKEPKDKKDKKKDKEANKPKEVKDKKKNKQEGSEE